MEKDKHHALKHGMWEDTSNFSHKEKLRVWDSAEGYIDQLGGEESLAHAEMYDCYLLALTEFRIARAEGVVFENVEEYLDKKTPEQNLDMLISRRQDLRKDLGLLSESPESKQAESASAFFEAMDE
jgi:hypothetical protein